MTFGRRRPSVEDDLRWKTTFGGRRPSVENDLCWMITFGGRRSSVEGDLWWKTTFGGRQPWMEDDLLWKTPFGGRRPLLEDNPQANMTFSGSLHAACSALRHLLDNKARSCSYLYTGNETSKLHISIPDHPTTQFSSKYFSPWSPF